MKRRLLLIILIILSISINIGCNKEETKDTTAQVLDQPIAVEVVEATVGSIESVISYSSRVKPAQEIMVMPKQPGKVVKVNFEIGQRVNKGQILFEMDKVDAQLQLNQAAAAVEMAEINLKRLSGSTMNSRCCS